MNIKPVVGYEDCYIVSDCGRVFSCDRYITYTQCKRANGYTRLHKGIELKLNVARGGYLCVNLSNNCKHSNQYAHVLVAKAFIGDIPKGYEVNHIDKNRANNHVSNLEIVSHRANVLHGKGYKGDYKTVESKCLELIAEGMVSTTELSKALSISTGSVLTILKANNIEPLGIVIGRPRTKAEIDYYVSLRKVDRPTKEELEELIPNNTFVALGKKYGVSDNAIRKWCKSYGLTYKKHTPKSHR